MSDNLRKLTEIFPQKVITEKKDRFVIEGNGSKTIVKKHPQSFSRILSNGTLVTDIDRVLSIKVHCIDCGINVEEIREKFSCTSWNHIQNPICINCLELRLGRQLNITDFKICLLNQMVKIDGSEKLKNRMIEIPQLDITDADTIFRLTNNPKTWL